MSKSIFSKLFICLVIGSCLSVTGCNEASLVPGGSQTREFQTSALKKSADAPVQIASIDPFMQRLKKGNVTDEEIAMSKKFWSDPNSLIIIDSYNEFSTRMYNLLKHEPRKARLFKQALLEGKNEEADFLLGYTKEDVVNIQQKRAKAAENFRTYEKENYFVNKK